MAHGLLAFKKGLQPWLASGCAFALELFTLAAGGLALAPTVCASPAASICVACVEPDRRYRCEVTSGGNAQTEEAKASGATLDASNIDAKSLPLLCAARIAHDNGHASCSVASGAKTCNGVPKTYSMAELASPADPKPLAGETEDPEPNSGEPGTVADMTKETLDKSRENMRKAQEAVDKAGAAVGDAAKRTLRCLGLTGGDC